MSTLYSFIQHDDKLQEEFYHSNYNLEDIMTFLKIDDETVQIFQPKSKIFH